MGWCIGFIVLLWLATKAKPRVRVHKTISCGTSVVDGPIYVTADELDDLICRVDELEERLREVEG